VKGGTFVFGSPRDSTRFNPWNQGSCCYAHGCYAGLATNGLFRIDAWTADLTTIEGDLVESWDFSEDGLTLNMKLREGVMFIDEASMPEDSTVPAEFNGGRILGDEFVCEDAKASIERAASPPEWEQGSFTPIEAKAALKHLGSATCPDGPRGYSFVMQFEYALARTMTSLSAHRSGQVAMHDKDYIAWVNAYGEREGRSFGDTEVPANFYATHGTGPFAPADINTSVSTTFNANPNYWREGLPLLDVYHNVVIKDAGTRFVALSTGRIHYMGEGSYSMRPGQAEQAIRDFSDSIVINNQLNNWAREVHFGARPPWDDVRVRKAMSLALNRDGWVEFYRIPQYEGGKLGHLMAPGTFYAPTDEELRTWPGYRQPKDEDIAEANRLLDEVFGPGERPEINCMARAVNPSDTDGCLFVIDQLKKNLNWSVKADFVDSAVVTDRSNAGTFDIYCGSVVSTAIGDPDDYLPWNLVEDLGYISTKNQINGLKAELPEVMDWMETNVVEQSRELDPVKRQEVVWEIQRRAANELTQITTLGWTNIFPSWRRELKGFKGYDLYSYTKSVANERMWIADN
jgi:peptide/nickel transport system substrate-binding protein